MEAQDFKYLVPSSIDEAIAWRQQFGAQARFIAGGTEVVPMMTRGKLTQTCLIELSRLDALAGLSSDNGGLRAGASVTLAQLQHSSMVNTAWSALAEAAASIREPQVRNRGTIGGNVAHGVPSADLVPPLLAFDAVLTLRGPSGERRVPLTEFLVGPYTTALATDELVADICLPKPAAPLGSAFLKLTKFKGSGLSVATVAAAIAFDDGAVAHARVAVGSVGPVPRRVPAAEALLLGRRLTPELLAEVGAHVAEADQSREGSIRASPAYRRRVLKPLAERVIARAAERLGFHIDGALQ